MAWKLYTDSALTTEFGGTLQFAHKADFSDNPQDGVLYYGNIDEDPGDNQVMQQEALSNPGVDDIAVSIVDADVGSGHEADEITLALTAAALDTNVAGASLVLGTTLLSGVSEAVEVHYRVANAVDTPSVSSELSLSWTETVDTAV